MTNTINVTMFVVPNSATTIDKAPEGLAFMVEKNINKLALFGIDYQRNEPGVEVWVYCPDDKAATGNDNWTDHGIGDNYHDMFTATNEDVYAFNRIPLSAIAGKKEGDVLTYINPLGNVINITLQQMGHRYCEHGGFDALRDTVMLSYARQSAYEEAHGYVTYGTHASVA